MISWCLPDRGAETQ